MRTPWKPRCTFSKFLIGLLLPIFVFANIAFADWDIVYRGAVDLNRNGFLTVDELSGVSLLQGNGNAAEFMAIQDEDGRLARFSAVFSVDGTIQSATVSSTLQLSDTTLDTEGIAFVDGRMFIAYERNEAVPTPIPGVREYAPTSGVRLQNLAIPSVWTVPGNVRSNRGFEALAADAEGNLWTGNEEALTIDGPLSTTNVPTIIRMQQLNPTMVGDSGIRQFAYEVDPPHGANPDRSGLGDLVILPNGELLTLERSASISFPVFENRMYTVDYRSATDTSQSQFDSGLAGQVYDAAEKSLLWSGQVAIPAGSNVEGLALGPRMANGNWLLVGVVDNSGGSSGNYVASWELSWTNSGDFNQDGIFECDDIDALISQIAAGSSTSAFDLTGDGLVDGLDQAEWLAQAGLAKGFGGPILAGDADLNGVVDVSDFNRWNSAKFTNGAGWCGADFNHDGTTDVSDFNLWNTNKFQSSDALAVPEPCLIGWSILMMVCLLGRSRLLR